MLDRGRPVIAHHPSQPAAVAGGGQRELAPPVIGVELIAGFRKAVRGYSRQGRPRVGVLFAGSDGIINIAYLPQQKGVNADNFRVRTAGQQQILLFIQQNPGLRVAGDIMVSAALRP